MSRFRPQVGPSISLFPFLAVLLCTMGSLLVLLVLFSSSANRAEADAASAAAAEAAKAAREELELAREEMAWRIEQMAGMRARTMDDLSRARMQLAGIESDSRQLVDALDELERTAAALETEPDESEEPLQDLEQRLAAARAKLDEAKKNAADRPPAYAVVPYDGDSGTRRRPLYIECCVDGVFLQPEGIRLGPADFEGPPGPGNPLASALRAAREYIASRPGESGDPNAQPYPLLLVRPSGVMAYYAARESLQSWGSDFGYQFIDEDWTLNFPPADPAMAAAENRAIEEARRRLEWLAQVRPPKRTKPVVQYRASTSRGGVVAAGGPSVLGDQSRWDWTEEGAGSPGGSGKGFRAGGDGQGQGDAVLGNGSGDPSGGDSRWAAGGNTPQGNRYMGPSKFYGGAGDGQGPGGADAAGGVEGGHGSMANAAAQGPGGTDGSQSAGGQSGTGGAGETAGQFGPGQAGSAGCGSGGSSMQQAGQNAAAGGGGSGGQAMSGMPQSASASLGGPAAMGQEGCSGSLAGRRGSNWASLASHDRPIPLTRPIRLECARDEFRVLGDRGRVVARVPIHGATADAVDLLVREVHATVGSWGIAGDRMYWRPELVLSSTPDGTARLADLEQLLADSGLDTRRATLPRETVRPLPPVYRTGTGGQPPAY